MWFFAEVIVVDRADPGIPVAGTRIDKPQYVKDARRIPCPDCEPRHFKPKGNRPVWRGIENNAPLPYARRQNAARDRDGERQKNGEGDEHERMPRVQPSPELMLLQHRRKKPALCCWG